MKRRFGLTDADLDPKTSRVKYELNWARTYLNKVGLATYPGPKLLKITAAGRGLLHCKSCPDRICKECIEALRVDPGLVDGQYLGALGRCRG